MREDIAYTKFGQILVITRYLYTKYMNAMTSFMSYKMHYTTLSIIDNFLDIMDTISFI